MNKSGRFTAHIKAAGDDSGSFTAVMSAPTLDRDGEIIDAHAFDPLPDHIMIDVDHAMSVEKTVGSGRPYYDDDGVLMIDGTFASTPLAQDVRTLVNEGHIRTMSVAYMNANYETDPDDERPHLRRAELLNAGIVGIPSNREALILASKANRPDPDEPEQISTETPDESPDAKASGERPAVDVVSRPNAIKARGLLESAQL